MVLIRQASTQSPPLTALLGEWPQSNENKSNWPRHLPTPTMKVSVKKKHTEIQNTKIQTFAHPPMKVGVKNTKYKNQSLMKTSQIGPDTCPPHPNESGCEKYKLQKYKIQKSESYENTSNWPKNTKNTKIQQIRI